MPARRPISPTRRRTTRNASRSARGCRSSPATTRTRSAMSASSASGLPANTSRSSMTAAIAVRGPLRARSGHRNHGGEPGMQRQAGHRSTDVGRAMLRVEGPEFDEEPAGVVEPMGRRWVEPRQITWLCTPQSQLEGERSEIDRDDLRGRVCLASRVFVARPHPMRHAWAESTGSDRLAGRPTPVNCCLSAGGSCPASGRTAAIAPSRRRPPS